MLTSSRICRRPKYVSMVFAPETMRSSMMSRDEWARKWYFSDGDGEGRGVGACVGGWIGVEAGLGKVLRKRGLFC